MDGTGLDWDVTLRACGFSFDDSGFRFRGFGFRVRGLKSGDLDLDFRV